MMIGLRILRGYVVVVALALGAQTLGARPRFVLTAFPLVAVLGRDDHELRHDHGQALQRGSDVLHADDPETGVVEDRDAGAGDALVERDEHRSCHIHSRHRLRHRTPTA